MTEFLARWVLIVFCWGGVGMILYVRSKLKPNEARTVSVDVRELRTSLLFLLWFVVVAAIATSQLSAQVLGYPRCLSVQVVLNLLMGVVFLMFLGRLWKSIGKGKAGPSGAGS